VTWGWLAWPLGVVLIVGAGFSATYLARRRSRDLHRRTAWAIAHAAIDAASVSRDAARTPNAEAASLLARAELIAADRGGLTAARQAADCADRASRLWQEDDHG